ncbi:MAG TPA: hypothetical protein VJZ04_04995 [Lachnospiraceae bacterium]|nr:hypothetical protein [Lachnospiraceae bacterium]
MSVNGITGTTSKADYYNPVQSNSVQSASNDKASITSPAKEGGVVYEASSDSKVSDYKTANADFIARLQADLKARTEQFQSLVQQMLSKQGNSYGQANDIWKFLSSGNYTVDAETKAKAQADIADDGYWGINQTSDRIVDFAMALTGGDADKMKEMQDAFKKGFGEATKSWGKELPDISSKTYDAVMSKFDKLQEKSK